MKEIMNFHIGQGGVQMGTAMWELFCVEHRLDESGHQMNEADTELRVECLDTYFTRSPNNRLVPRAMFVDLEPSVVDELRTNEYRKLYHPDRMVTGLEDAASNFARGFFTVGKLILGKVSNETRKMFEACDCVHGMVIYRSLGGGTGAGLTSALFDMLADYPKTPKLEVPIYPSPSLSSSTVEPYNTVLAQHFCIEDTDISLLFDNEALYEIYSHYLYNQKPTFNMVNRLIALVLSSVTASLRFENSLHCDLTLLQINLVPYPRIHFPACNFAPIAGYSKLKHETVSVDELTRSVFAPDNQMVKINLNEGRYMSCVMFYRGSSNPYSIYKSLSLIKRDRRLEFVDWCPTGFKVGINLSMPDSVPGSLIAPTNKTLTMLTNSSAIGQLFQRICHKFYLLYSKKSFLHWFVGDGMEESEFTESLYNITALVKDYEEVSLDTTDENSKLKDPMIIKQNKNDNITPIDKLSKDQSTISAQPPSSQIKREPPKSNSFGESQKGINKRTSKNSQKYTEELQSTTIPDLEDIVNNSSSMYNNNYFMLNQVTV